MARTSGNMMISGIRGKLGKFVFRKMRGETFVILAPRKPDKSKETVAQRNTRTTFKEAASWAKNQMLDPEKKKRYNKKAKKLKLPNGYTAAVREFMRRGGSKNLTLDVAQNS
jgi:hypothetical protein